MSATPVTVDGVFHPWRVLRSLTGVTLHVVELPGTMRGAIHDGHVWIDRRLLQAERRCTLTHELVHLAHGHHGAQDADTEARVQAEAAKLLIPIETLANALRWTRDVTELAEECWVDERTITARLNGLTSVERAMLEELARSIERPA